jgi:hypothetical protein
MGHIDRPTPRSPDSGSREISDFAQQTSPNFNATSLILPTAGTAGVPAFLGQPVRKRTHIERNASRRKEPYLEESSLAHFPCNSAHHRSRFSQIPNPGSYLLRRIKQVIGPTRYLIITRVELGSCFGTPMKLRWKNEWWVQ